MPPASPTDRRALLRIALATAAAGWLPRAAWTQPRWNLDPFALGVASGAPTHEGVVLWTRLVGDVPDGPVTVRWEVADDPAFARIVRSGQQQALPALAHAVHVEVQGLAPDRWYHYRFMSGDAVSRTGRTRTFPAPGAPAQRLRLAYASCQRYEHGYFGAYRHMVAEDLDAVLFLGDYIYEYPGDWTGLRIPPGGWAFTLADYRRRHALHKAEPELQAMHAACPWLLTWDDHEVQNDYAQRVAGSGGPAIPDFPARRAAAYQAYYEHMPLPAAALARAVEGLAGGAELRLYGRHRFGNLADILLLDNRQYRDAQACTPAGRPGGGTVHVADCDTWNDPARSLLGAAQEQWLDGALAGRQGAWTVLGQQTLFGRRVARVREREVRWNDGWDGYPAARGRLLGSLERHGVANTVFLGGDLHENWVGHVKADYERPDSRTLGVEFCGTSITSRPSRNRAPEVDLPHNPHFVLADASRRGYGVAEFTPGRLVTTLRVLDDVRQRDTGVSTLARFEVAAGSARLERAA